MVLGLAAVQVLLALWLYRKLPLAGSPLRPARPGAEPGDHLLAALDHAHGAVLAQMEVGAKTNEIPMFPSCWIALRSPVRSSPPTRCMPSAPTPLTWPAAALTVKRNQPGLFA